MELALGLLETKGLIGAIEAADAMAKAADVKIICKEKSTAALVTIKIVGETAAVRSALDAGAAAAEKIGQLLSVHIIPHPDNEIEYLIENTEKVVANPRLGSNVPDESNVPEEQADENVREVAEPEPAEKTSEKAESPDDDADRLADEISLFESHHVSDIEDEEFGEDIVAGADEEDNTEASESEEEEAAEDEPDYSIRVPIEETEELEEEEEEEVSDVPVEIPPIEELEEMSVPELRRLARGVPDFPIKGREISKANKTILLEYFRSLS